MNPFQSYVAKSRYARFIDKEGRREHWPETVSRYFDFMQAHLSDKHSYTLTPELRTRLQEAVTNLEVVPSMRSIMTAGDALARQNVAGYNCAYLPIDDPKSFDEAMYILLCFHPDTLVKCKGGDKRIADITSDDEVVSFNEVSKSFEYKQVLGQIRTPSAQRSKVSVQLDTGVIINCTADHTWLTSNRGYVEAQHLTADDDLVAPTHEVYKHTNKTNGKSYIGHTSKGFEYRFKQHLTSATNEQTQGYNSHFHKALRKYSADVWVTEIIDFAYSAKESQEKEIYWINELGTYGSNGYNETTGGEGAQGYKWSDELRLESSNTAYERTPAHRSAQSVRMLAVQEQLIAQRRTPEAREKARIGNTGENNPMYGRKHPPERIAQLREQTTGRGNPFYGKTHSEETKQKISNTKKMKKEEATA